MTYEYEETIKEELEFTDLDNTDNQDKMLKELQEVYRKAKAWEELKNKLTEDYIEQIRYINQHSITDANDTWSSGWNMSTAQQLYTDLHLIDQLDGTNEFSNLLNDLEDE